MTAARTKSTTSEAAIFARLWEGSTGRLTAPLARHVLKLKFDESDVARMKDLAARNRAGALPADELEELDNFIRVGDLLATLQSKARQLLKSVSAPLSILKSLETRRAALLGRSLCSPLAN